MIIKRNWNKFLTKIEETLKHCLSAFEPFCNRISWSVIDQHSFLKHKV